MKIFLDTANIEDIKRLSQLGIVDGVTTNPTHLSKENKNPTKQVIQICKLLPHGVISVEITEKEPTAVYNQARKIADLAQNVTVKIPCHEKYFTIIKQLVQEKISLNITLVFSLIQGLIMCKLGVDYISPFIGRLDDIDCDGLTLVSELRMMIDHYHFKTKIIAASIRDILHINQTIMIGADIATVPVEVLEKGMNHPLTDKGMTKFLQDWQKLNIKKFP